MHNAPIQYPAVGSSAHAQNKAEPAIATIQTVRMNVSPHAALSVIGPLAKVLMLLLGRLRRYLRTLSPYGALVVLALPLSIIEPLKLVAAVIFGSGHWVFGLLVMLVAYALSIFVVERLFQVVKPTLLKLPWFVALWKMVVALREKTRNWLRRSAARRSGAS